MIYGGSDSIFLRSIKGLNSNNYIDSQFSIFHIRRSSKHFKKN